MDKLMLEPVELGQTTQRTASLNMNVSYECVS